MKLNCAYRDTDGYCLKYSTYSADVPCLGNPSCGGFAEDFGADTNVGHKTNADHIRSMSDEELKVYLCYISDCAMCLWQSSSGCKLEYWLKQPYEGIAE